MHMDERFMQERYPHLVVLLSGVPGKGTRVSSEDHNRIGQVARDLIDLVLKRNAMRLSTSVRRRLVKESAQRILQNYRRDSQRLDTSSKEAAGQTIDDEISYLSRILSA
jgi:hypothetical protein